MDKKGVKVMVLRLNRAFRLMAVIVVLLLSTVFVWGMPTSSVGAAEKVGLHDFADYKASQFSHAEIHDIQQVYKALLLSTFLFRKIGEKGWRHAHY